MKDFIEEDVILARYLSSVKKYGNEKIIKRAIDRGRSYIKEHPKNKIVRPVYSSLLRFKCEDSEVIIEAIEDNLSYLKDHPEEIPIRSSNLRLIQDKGFLKIRYIKQALEDAEHHMIKFSSSPLFQDYIALILKVIKNEINININIELIKKLGNNFLSLKKKGRYNIIAAIDFADFLWTLKYYDESKVIYEELLLIKMNSETKSNVYFSYGKMLLDQAMSLKLKRKEYLEKLNEAEKKFKNATGFNEMHYMAFTFLNIILRKKGKKEEAKNVLENAEIVRKKYKEKTGKKFFYGEIPYKIGDFYFKFNCYKNAIFWFEIASKDNPDHFANWWRLGYAKFKLALILKEKGFPNKSQVLFKESLFNLEMSIEKKPKLFQLPASKVITDLIEKCKNNLLQKL